MGVSKREGVPSGMSLRIAHWTWRLEGVSEKRPRKRWARRRCTQQWSRSECSLLDGNIRPPSRNQGHLCRENRREVFFRLRQLVDSPAALQLQPRKWLAGDKARFSPTASSIPQA